MFAMQAMTSCLYKRYLVQAVLSFVALFVMKMAG